MGSCILDTTNLSLLDFHQDWIMEQWEKNYYISSIVGAANGSSLVVMSKGCITLPEIVKAFILRICLSVPFFSPVFSLHLTFW